MPARMKTDGRACLGPASGEWRRAPIAGQVRATDALRLLSTPHVQEKGRLPGEWPLWLPYQTWNTSSNGGVIARISQHTKSIQANGQHQYGAPNSTTATRDIEQDPVESSFLAAVAAAVAAGCCSWSVGGASAGKASELSRNHRCTIAALKRVESSLFRALSVLLEPTTRVGEVEDPFLIEAEGLFARRGDGPVDGILFAGGGAETMASARGRKPWQTPPETMANAIGNHGKRQRIRFRRGGRWFLS